MLIHYLLDDVEQLKLESYRLLITEPSLTFTDLRKSLRLTKNKMTMIINELESDLKDISGEDISLLQADGDTLLMPSDAPIGAIYRQNLLENSLIIRLFSFILTHPEGNLEDFCQENFLSRATAFRRLTNLQELIAPYHLKLNTSQLQLTGKELAVRHFLGTLFWSIKPDLATHYPLNDSLIDPLIDDVVATFDEQMAYGNRNQIDLFLRIAELRRQGGYFVEPGLTSNDFPLCEDVWQTHHQNFSAYLARTTPSKFVAAEEMAFYFQIYTGALYARVDTPSYIAYREWMKQQSEIQMIISDFGDKLLSNFFDRRPPEHFDVLMANIMGTFNLSYLLKDTPSLNYMFFESSLRADTPVFLEIETFSRRFFQNVARKKDFQWLKPVYPQLASLFAYFLLPTFNTQLATKKLRIAVTNENNFVLILPLHSFLETVPYVDYVPYPEDGQEEIDLLISPHTNFLPEGYNGPVYLYSYRDVQDDFIHLRSLLEKLHLQKCFGKKCTMRPDSKEELFNGIRGFTPRQLRHSPSSHS